jgi:hypothetical protein
MRISLDITLRGTPHDPMPQDLDRAVQEAFDQELPVKFQGLSFPDTTIISVDRSFNKDGWSITWHAEGRSVS